MSSCDKKKFEKSNQYHLPSPSCLGRWCGDVLADAFAATLQPRGEDSPAQHSWQSTTLSKPRYQ